MRSLDVTGVKCGARIGAMLWLLALLDCACVSPCVRSAGFASPAGQNTRRANVAAPVFVERRARPSVPAGRRRCFPLHLALRSGGNARARGDGNGDSDAPHPADELCGLGDREQCSGGLWGSTGRGRAASNLYDVYDIYAHGVTDEELYGRRVASPLTYGNTYGPCAGHTWAAEGVLLASLRQALGEDDGVLRQPQARGGVARAPRPGLGDSQPAQGRREKAARQRRGGVSPQNRPGRNASGLEARAPSHAASASGGGGEPGAAPAAHENDLAEVVVASGSIRARPVLHSSDGLVLCCLVARCLLRVVRVVFHGGTGSQTRQGLVLQVISRQGLSLQDHTFSLLTADGLLLSVAVSSVVELVLLTLGGIPPSRCRMPSELDGPRRFPC